MKLACDICEKIATPKDNGNIEGWMVLKTKIPVPSLEAGAPDVDPGIHNYRLCIDCQKLFYDFMGIEYDIYGGIEEQPPEEDEPVEEPEEPVDDQEEAPDHMAEDNT